MKRLPWKGSEVVRLPRVRIPLSPPMKNELEALINAVEFRIEQIFDQVQINPTNLSKDKELVDMAEFLGLLLNKHEKIKEV